MLEAGDDDHYLRMRKLSACALDICARHLRSTWAPGRCAHPDCPDPCRDNDHEPRSGRVPCRKQRKHAPSVSTTSLLRLVILRRLWLSTAACSISSSVAIAPRQPSSI